MHVCMQSFMINSAGLNIENVEILIHDDKWVFLELVSNSIHTIYDNHNHVFPCSVF